MAVDDPSGLGEVLDRWGLDAAAVRERLYRAPTPRERERWHAVCFVSTMRLVPLPATCRCLRQPIQSTTPGLCFLDNPLRPGHPASPPAHRIDHQ